MIPYAETHYKFRLPWSPLWRPRPEIVADCPHTVIPGREVPLWLVVHDAHRFPVRLRSARVVVQGESGASGAAQAWKSEVEPDMPLDRPFHWVRLPWPGPDQPGRYQANVLFAFEDRHGRLLRFLNHDLPGLDPWPLVVDRLSEGFPFPASWVSGDLHCHSTWSEDPVEFGGDLAVMQQAAAALGLGFFASTDHSYDFAWEHPDYMRPADPIARFAAFRAAAPTDADGTLPVVLPSEEVSCGNHRGENVHLLLVDHPEYLPGQGDGGRRWLRNRPDLPLSAVLERATAHGSPAIAAHPIPGYGLAQRLLFRRGDYHAADMLPGLTGLQFWNGEPGDDFRRGRGLWISELLAGRHRLPIAGNDAHGDLNRATAVSLPLVRLVQTRKHRFGHARTWLPLDGLPPTRQTLRLALRQGPAVVSDGPALLLAVDGDPGAAATGETSDSRIPGAGARGSIALRARSLPEFGGWHVVRIWGHRAGEASETLLAEIRPEGALTLDETIAAPAGLVYARAEGVTASGRRALTGAHRCGPPPGA